jgi:hypothetical protein
MSGISHIGRLFRQKRSGLLVGPSAGQLLAAAPHWLYHVTVFDERKRLVAEQHLRNLVTREGIGYLLGCAFAVTSPPSKKANFFVTQFKTNTSPATTQTASTPVYTEIVMTTDVSQTVRPTLTLGALSTGADAISADNSASKATFNHLTSITLYGLAVVSVNAAGTSSGYTGDILYGTVLYSPSLAVQNGYQVDVQATLQATAG